MNNNKAHEMNTTCSELPPNFQDQYDEYVSNTFAILNNPDQPVDPFVESTLRLGLSILGYYKHSVQEVEFYRKKYTKVPPLELEMSQIKNCYIGKCRCGQLLIENKDKCCPRCSQFIAWPDDSMDDDAPRYTDTI